MNLSKKAQDIYGVINKEGTKLGDLRNFAKEIKKDQQLAEELWGTGGLMPRLLAILIFDTKALTLEVVDTLLKAVPLKSSLYLKFTTTLKGLDILAAGEARGENMRS